MQRTDGTTERVKVFCSLYCSIYKQLCDAVDLFCSLLAHQSCHFAPGQAYQVLCERSPPQKGSGNCKARQPSAANLCEKILHIQGRNSHLTLCKYILRDINNIHGKRIWNANDLEGRLDGSQRIVSDQNRLGNRIFGNHCCRCMPVRRNARRYERGRNPAA